MFTYKYSYMPNVSSNLSGKYKYYIITLILIVKIFIIRFLIENKTVYYNLQCT